MPEASTGDGLSLGVSLVLIEIPDDDWVRQAIITALDVLAIEGNWREIGSNTPEISAAVFSLILATVQFDYEPPDMIPVGMMTEWPALAAPSGWLFCQGQSLLRADYAALFDVIDVTWGAVDGTHFSLPDMRNFSPMGANTVGTVDLATTAGSDSQLLSVSDLPVHNHGITDPGHAHTVTDPGHTHVVERATNTAGGTTPRHTMPNNTLDSNRNTGNSCNRADREQQYDWNYHAKYRFGWRVQHFASRNWSQLHYFRGHIE